MSEMLSKEDMERLWVFIINDALALVSTEAELRYVVRELAFKLDEQSLAMLIDELDHERAAG